MNKVTRKGLAKGIAALLDYEMKICKEHQERRRRWISAAHDVAKWARHSKARAVVRFLKERSIAGRVDSSSEPGFGFIRCQKTSMKNPIIFVVPNKGERCSRIKGAYGSFISSINVLAIQNEPLSSFTRGMITLHEGQHAMWAHTQGRKISKDIDQKIKDTWRAIDEYYAQELEIEVLFRIGGEKFEEIVFEASMTHAREVCIMSDGSFVLSPLRDFSKEFTAIFGRSLSERENRLRATWIAAAACNRYVDSLYPNDLEAAFETKVSGIFIQLEGVAW